MEIQSRTYEEVHSPKQKDFKEIFTQAFRPLLGEDSLVVEHFQDKDTLTSKVRVKWNDWLAGIGLRDLTAILFRIRTLLNNQGYRRTKLQVSLHLDPNYSEKTNIRIIYNPQWRKYENFEIFFRNKTQSRRV